MLRAVLITMLSMAIAAFGAAAAACDDGGGESLTLEEYFERFTAIDQNVDAEIEELFADFPDVSDEEFFANDANLPLIKSIFEGFPRVLREALDELAGLDPPAEAEDAHDALLDAGRDLQAAFEQANEDIADVETAAEAQAISQARDEEVAPAEQAFDEACLALVGVATENGLTVDVSCDDEE